MTGRQGALSIPKAPRGVQLYLLCYCASQLQIRNAETAPSDTPFHAMCCLQQRLMRLARLAAAAANHIDHFLLFLRWLALGARVVLVRQRDSTLETCICGRAKRRTETNFPNGPHKNWYDRSCHAGKYCLLLVRRSCTSALCKEYN